MCWKISRRKKLCRKICRRKIYCRKNLRIPYIHILFPVLLSFDHFTYARNRCTLVILYIYLYGNIFVREKIARNFRRLLREGFKQNWDPCVRQKRLQYLIHMRLLRYSIYIIIKGSRISKNRHWLRTFLCRDFLRILGNSFLQCVCMYVCIHLCMHRYVM